MIEKVWRVDEWRAQFTREKDAAQKKLYSGMQRLAREIYVAALVRHNSMDEALMAVYLTGLYHATELAKTNTDQPTLE
jgi:hypothetical protein